MCLGFCERESESERERKSEGERKHKAAKVLPRTGWKTETAACLKKPDDRTVNVLGRILGWGDDKIGISAKGAEVGRPRGGRVGFDFRLSAFREAPWSRAPYLGFEVGLGRAET